MCDDSLEKQALARKLFHCSPLKREKFFQITELLGDVRDQSALDLGSDNGVISLLLRERGGTWKSADISQATVDSIRALVGSEVYLLGDSQLPFADESFDVVVVVDLLEHIQDDVTFCRDLHRVLRPNGRLLVNVPNPKEGLIRKVRFALGQTDAEHGHLRPGYTLSQLKEVVGDEFSFVKSRSYSRLFSLFVDTAILGALHLLKGGTGGVKGTVVTADNLQSQKKKLRLFSFVAPFLRLAVSFDRLVPFLHGNMLLAEFRRT